MAYCLRVPSHNVNQCLFTIGPLGTSVEFESKYKHSVLRKYILFENVIFTVVTILLKPHPVGSQFSLPDWLHGHCPWPVKTSVEPSYFTVFTLPPLTDLHNSEIHHQHRKRHESDSDSDLSAVENPDLELASSHSSDDDEMDPYWNRKYPKNKVLGERLSI